MADPLVSVVMPVYNREERLALAVESILAQEFEDFEFIIVDDGSTDGTLSRLQHYAQKEPRLRILPLPSNGGQGLARALGVDAAKGRYIAVMDSDDVAYPQRLASQVAFMEAHPELTLAGADAIKILPQRQYRMPMPRGDGEIKARLLLVDCAFVHPTVIMRRSFLLEHNLNYSAERRGDDDYEFYNRLMVVGATFANQPEVLLDFYRNEENTSANTPRLEQDKLPLRCFLLQRFFPDLTYREAHSLATIMQAEVDCTLKQAMAGLLAGEKALNMKRSEFGVDRGVLDDLIIRYMRRMDEAVKRQPS